MDKKVIDSAIIRDFIYSTDLSKVKSALVNHGWSRSDANDACELYKNYIYLRWKYQDVVFPPSVEIDEVWQHHILETQAYRQFCEKIFTNQEDKYLDRTFDSNDKKHRDKNATDSKFENITQKIYKDEFGECIPTIRHISFFSKVGKFLKNIGFKWLSASVLVGLFSGGYAIVSAHNNFVTTNYNELIQHIRNVSFDLEDTILMCSPEVKKKYPAAYIRQLFKVNADRREHFGLLLNSMLNLRHENIFTKEAYSELLLFVYQTNGLYKSGINICQIIPFKSIDKVDAHRRKLVASMEKSANAYLWQL